MNHPIHELFVGHSTTIIPLLNNSENLYKEWGLLAFTTVIIGYDDGTIRLFGC